VGRVILANAGKYEIIWLLTELKRSCCIYPVFKTWRQKLYKHPFLNKTFKLSFAYDFENFIVENAPEYVQRISW